MKHHTQFTRHESVNARQCPQARERSNQPHSRYFNVETIHFGLDTTSTITTLPNPARGFEKPLLSWKPTPRNTRRGQVHVYSACRSSAGRPRGRCEMGSPRRWPTRNSRPSTGAGSGRTTGPSASTERLAGGPPGPSRTATRPSRW